MEEIKLDNDHNEQPEKNNKNTKIIIAIAIMVIVVVLIGIILGFALDTNSDESGNSGHIGTRYLTYRNYERIQTGMSYSEVVNIFGGNQGVLSTSSSYGGYTLSFYTWSNSSGTICVSIGFENNRVCAKSQYGLR